MSKSIPLGHLETLDFTSGKPTVITDSDIYSITGEFSPTDETIILTKAMRVLRGPPIAQCIDSLVQSPNGPEVTWTLVIGKE